MRPPDSPDHPPALRMLLHGRRTRVVVALIGVLLGIGAPIAVLNAPAPTVDGHPIGSLADPAGLGVTGATPGDPLPGSPLPSDEVLSGALSGDGVTPGGVPADPASTSLPGIPTPNLPDGPLGIPGVVLDAYQFAHRTLAAIRPGCHLSWSVLAGIGRIESNHASDGRVDAFGNTLGSILGPRLDGSPGVAAIPDTDHGQLDGDPVWDRAVGPMQFIPASWRAFGVDGNGDGVANPNNIYDATVTTGIYLCSGGNDLTDPAQLQAAVFRYNHSATYVDIVLRWAQAYLTGVTPTPSAPGPVPPGITGNGGRTVATLLAAVTPPAITHANPLAPTAPAKTTSSPPSPVTTTTPPTTTTSTSPPSPAPSPTTTPPASTTSSPSPAPTTSSPPPPATPTPPVGPSPSPTPSPTPVSALQP